MLEKLFFNYFIIDSASNYQLLLCIIFYHVDDERKMITSYIIIDTPRLYRALCTYIIMISLMVFNFKSLKIYLHFIQMDYDHILNLLK